MNGSLLTPLLLPAPACHSPVSLRGAASFYSDGADPRLFRVVTKPAARCRVGAEGGGTTRLPLPKTPARLRRLRQVRSGVEGGRRPPPPRLGDRHAAAAPPARRPGLGDLPPGDGGGRRSRVGGGGRRLRRGPGRLRGTGVGVRPSVRVCGNGQGSARRYAPADFASAGPGARRGGSAAG